MAELVKKQQKHFDVLAEGLTADGRVAKRVEARADDLADVAEAFRLAAAEARTAHIAVARVRCTAGRAGVTELAVVLEDSPVDPLTQSAMLDGKTKLDAPPPVLAVPCLACRLGPGTDRIHPRDCPNYSDDCADCGVPVGTYHKVGCTWGPGATGRTCGSCQRKPGEDHTDQCPLVNPMPPPHPRTWPDIPAREQELLEELARQAPGWTPWTIEYERALLAHRVTGRSGTWVGQVTVLITNQSFARASVARLARDIIDGCAKYVRDQGATPP